MTQKIDCVMLVDDNEMDNFFHSRVLEKSMMVDSIVVKSNVDSAITYLTDTADGGYQKPDIIFLDINMPHKNGWDFLEEYAAIDEESRADIVILMLTTSLLTQDRQKAEANPLVSGFENKPLSRDGLEDLIKKYTS